ncbi:lipoate--protein ligase family protein [candidate division TA06 bacterium]|nr:lipoate--protein ligase family protein [candidate division TA06 bacterium]
MRIIDDKGQDAFTNMAVDEALFQGYVRGKSPTTLRFYTFSPPAITLGYSQRIEEVDLECCRKFGIDVVRRPTGGRAVIHDGDLTYSLIAESNDPLFGGSLHETYQKVSEYFAKALREIGIEAHLVKHEPRPYKGRSEARSMKHEVRSSLCFSSPARYELLVVGEKVMGSAQMRKNGSFLLQGSLKVDEPSIDYHFLFQENGFLLPKSLTSIPSPVIAMAPWRQKKSRWLGTGQGTKIGVERLKYFMEESLGMGWKRGILTEGEQEQVVVLRAKYVSPKWNFRR